MDGQVIEVAMADRKTKKRISQGELTKPRGIRKMLARRKLTYAVLFLPNLWVRYSTFQVVSNEGKL